MRTDKPVNSRLLRSLPVIACGVAWVVIVIAIATPGWRAGALYSQGLWQHCSPIGCVFLYNANESVVATQVLLSLALLILTGALVLGVVFVFATRATMVFLIGFSVASFISMFFMMLGIIVYAAWSDDDKDPPMSYSFAFAMASMFIIIFANGLLLLVGFKRKRDGVEECSKGAPVYSVSSDPFIHHYSQMQSYS